uniref:hypothetical protein n=1 Tax=Gemmiger formicilis TaxID=745368 RepID=UPI003FEE1B84
MGPLELGDFVGLDICLAIMDVLQGDRRPVPRLPADPQDGPRRQPGLQDRQGFYVYNADRTKTPVDAL